MTTDFRDFIYLFIFINVAVVLLTFCVTPVLPLMYWSLFFAGNLLLLPLFGVFYPLVVSYGTSD